MKLNVKKSSAMNQIRKMTSLVAVYVIIKLQQRIILKLIFNINMKVSIQAYLLSMLVIIVINNTQTSGAVNYTYRLNMKVSSILAISVITNL